MKKRILLFTIVAGIGVLAFSSYQLGAGTNGFDCTGADASTGSGNPTGCYLNASCHHSSATSGITLVLELDSAGVTTSSTASGTGHYKPGHTYTVKLTGTNTTSTTNLGHFGFQVAATKGSTAPTTASTSINAGTFQSTGLPAGVHYVAAPGSSATFYANVVEHSSPRPATTGTGGSGTTYVESFTWTAPAAGTGAVSLWAALNAVNFNGSADAGDMWNTAHLVLNEMSTTSVPDVSINTNISVYPNPVTNVLNLQTATAGAYSVTVYDMNGRIYANEQMNGQTQTINTSSWVPGLYQVVVASEDARQVIPVVKQ